jgi:hypothetical protein
MVLSSVSAADGTHERMAGLSAHESQHHRVLRLGRALLPSLSQTIFKVPVEAHENNAYRRVAKGFRNPRRVQDAPLRIPFLTLSVVLFYPILLIYFNLRLLLALLSYSLVLLTTVVLYLMACDPLPPCAGKVTEWLRGMVPSRLAPSESPSRD